MWDRTRNLMLALYIFIGLSIMFTLGYQIGRVRTQSNYKATCARYITNIEEHEIKNVKVVNQDKSYMELNLKIPYSKAKEISKEDMKKLKDHYRLDYINTNYGS